MEIIDLSSGPSYCSSPVKASKHHKEVILISDDSEIHPQATPKDKAQVAPSKFESQFKSSDVISESLVTDFTQEVNSPKNTKKTSILDISWISGSEDDKFFNDHIVATSQKTSMNPPSLRREVLDSSPTSQRVMSSTLIDLPSKPPCGQSSEISTAKVSKQNLPASQLEFSDPISSSSIDTSPVRPAVVNTRKPKKSKQDTESGLSDKAWREANKLRRTKADILKEMICEVPLCLEEKIMTDHFKECFEASTIRRTYFELPLVTWKRRVTASYNAEQDTFVPCDPKEISERVLTLFYEASELVENIQNGIVELHIQAALRRAKLEDPLLDYHLVIIVPGFREYLRKLQSAEDKRYREQIQEKMNETSKRRKTSEPVSITANAAQNLISDAEVSLGVNIFMTKSLEETIDWLASFTYAIGNSLYDKHERNPEFANFGRIRSGSDRRSTFVEMMKKFNLMSNTKAENLYKFYTSPISIYKRLQKMDNLGTLNGKSIVPPSVNSAMKRFFTATDPSQVIND